MMKKVENLIIGAGIGGLSMANFLGGKYLILEKEKNAGGYCRTIKKDGFIWDYAGHFFHFRNPEMKKKFEEAIPVNALVKCKKNTKIDFKGKLIDYPFQKNIHQLDKEDFIDCLYDLYTRKEKNNYNSFEDMLFGKFGKGITEKFLKPYNEKLYACFLEMLDANAMGRFFPYADFDEIIRSMKRTDNVSYNEYFEYPRKGAEIFIDVLIEKLEQEKIVFNANIEKIDLHNKLLYYNGEVVKYDNLISTIPLNQFLMLYSEEEKLKNMDLSANKVLVLNLGFDKKSQYNEIHWIYYPDKDINFYRVGFYDNILDFDRLSLYVEIGFDSKAEIDIEVELEKTLLNLRKLKIIDNHLLVSHCALVMSPAYVHISESTQKKVALLEKELKEDDVYLIGRYGKWTYCSMEDVMLHAKELSEKLKNKV